MTILAIPARQNDRLALLSQVSARLKEELEGPSDMNPRLTKELIELTSAYEAAIQTLESQKRTKALLALAQATRIKDLDQLLRDFRVVTKRRANRRSNRQPNGERLAHIFPLASKLPSASQRNGLSLLHYGQQLVAAEAIAIGQGFEPSTNPSIAELEALMEGSEQLFAANDEAAYALKEAQIQLAELNEVVGPKLRFLGAHLRARFRNHSKTEVRALMRTYGFAFRSPKRALTPTEDPDQAPTEATTHRTQKGPEQPNPTPTNPTHPDEDQRTPEPNAKCPNKAAAPSAQPNQSPRSTEPKAPNRRSKENRKHRPRHKRRRGHGPRRKRPIRGRPNLPAETKQTDRTRGSRDSGDRHCFLNRLTKARDQG